jgi:hypothetical protein
MDRSCSCWSGPGSDLSGSSDPDPTIARYTNKLIVLKISGKFTLSTQYFDIKNFEKVKIKTGI